MIPALVLGNYIKSEAPQLFEVLVQCLSVGIDSACGQFLDNLRHSKNMVIISLIGKDLNQIQHLQFLVLTLAYL